MVENYINGSENIVGKFTNIFSTIRQEKGFFNLFMIIKMDELADKWSVVVSAPWVRQNANKEQFEYVTSIMRSNLTQEESSTIARVGLFTPTDEIVTLFNHAIQITNSDPVRLINNKINGYDVHEAWIYESLPPSQSSTPSPSPSL